MGGFGTWDIIQRHPTLFAAAMPVCGGGDTALAPQIKQIPVWAFHGDKDDTVKTSRSRDMIEALKKAGGTPRYTEYPGVRHDAWAPTYTNPAVLKWLFDQSK
jgi:predicted peptidase